MACLFLILLATALGLKAEPSGRHFVYAHYDFILTFEFTPQKEAILNVVNFTDQTYFLLSENITLADDQGRAVPVDKILIETGDPSDPYLTANMKILPNSFIGLVLTGKFETVSQFKSATLELGESRYTLDALSEPQFETAAEKINKMNFDSPDVREDFRVLKMDFFGHKEPAGDGKGRQQP